MQRMLILRPECCKPANINLALSRTFCHSAYQPRSSLALSIHSDSCSNSHKSVSQSITSCRYFSSTKRQSVGAKRTLQRSRAGSGSQPQHKALASKGPYGRGPASKSSPLKLAQGRSRSPQPTISAEEELKNVAKALKLPTIEEVPNLPKNIFKLPINALHPAISNLGEFHERSSVSNGVCKHMISIDDENFGKIQVLGHGSNKAVAKAAAYLHFLAELHENGMATAIFPLTAATADREKHAMIDVYLFAARYQDIPQIVSRTSGRRRVINHEIDVKLPLLGISVTGRGRTEKHAEIAAALNAKHEIEKYVTTDSAAERIVKEDEIFGFASAVAFCQWYKYQNRGVHIDIEHIPDRSGRMNTAVVSISDGVLEEEKKKFTATGNTKKAAEELAQFIAAVTLTREEPDLRTSFFEEYRRNNNQIMAPISPVSFDMGRDTSMAIRKAIDYSRHATEQLEEEEDTTNVERLRTTMYRPLLPLSYQKKCQELKKRREAYESREDLEKLRKTRSEYPMNHYAQEVLKIVDNNVFSIIIGATGSGKTTQVPQILLNHAVDQGNGASCNIICTQPRRIAAKSVSQRVADERAEFLGDCVGYHVKKDIKLPSYGGSINFCTTGILTQQLQHHADEIMDNASHLIIDEVHERDTIIDFLLTNLRRLIKHRISEGKKVPHVILMSATIDPELFSNYLRMENASGEMMECPNLSVPGRTFPVRELYLEDVIRRLQGSHPNVLKDPDTAKFVTSERGFTASNKDLQQSHPEDGENQAINWDLERKRATAKSRLTVEEQEQALVPHALAAATIAHIAETTRDGAILTFLPGLEDITKINDLLRLNVQKSLNFNDESKFKIFMLHSSIQNTQREVFDPVPPGCRKIILSTNIAETSITIPDVQHVVDTGKLRELQYDQTRRITKLSCVWVSKSNAKQRAGRAGRVQDGNYYALYTKERYKSLRAVGLPELLRSDLQEVCLSIKDQGYAVPIREFLSEAVEPPSMASVDGAIQNLIGLQALNKDESMTALGKLLAQLPVHPSLGKMIVLGIVFRCLDPMLIIGSSFSERSIFAHPLGARKEAREKKDGFSRNTLSDHIGLLAAVKELRMLYEVRGPRAMGDYAMRNFLHMGAFRSILSTAEVIETLLVDHGVISRTSKLDRAHFQFGDPRLNENSDKVGLIKALILAGFYPNLAIRRGRVVYRTPQEANVLVHPGSINAANLKVSKGKSDGPPPPVDPKTELLTFSELVRSSDGNNMYLRETTPVTPLMSVLFSGKLEQTRSRNIIKMDDWLPFYLDEPFQALNILNLHSMLQKVTTAAFNDLAARRVLTDHEDRNNFADSLVEVLDSDLASNAARSNRRSGDMRRPDPASAFAPSRRKTDGDRNSFGARSQDPKKQELWDNLIASWAQRDGNNSTAGGESQQRPSVASLFAEGHAELKSSSNRAFRSKGY